MSILRRLLLSVTLVIAVVLCGTLILSITAARDYLEGQLQTQSEDAATSLALTLSQPSNNDPVTQQLLVEALFDSGHFSLVRLADPLGKVIVERRIENTLVPVPHWFQSLVSLRADQASHVVTDGWRQLGTVTLVANSIYAWASLWESSLRLIWLMLVVGVLWGLFAFALVNWLKGKLLAEIGEHVRAMGRGELASGPVVARVAELSVVTEAIDQARTSLRAMAEEHTAQVESLKVELNRDPVTGAANRKYFMNEFRRVLEAENAESGHLVMFRQRDLAEINRHMPHAMVDNWLKLVYTKLAEIVAARGQSDMLLARLNGPDFALLFPKSDTPTAMQMAEALRAELRNQRIPVGEGGLCRWAVVLGDYAGGEQAGNPLTRIDEALMQAENAGDDRVFTAAEAGGAAQAKGEKAWRQIIEQGLKQSGFALGIDPAFTDAAGKALRHEASLTLRDPAGGAAPLGAGLFIPAAARLGMVADCDLEAVRLGLEWLRSNTGDLVTRVALITLKSGDFLPRLEKMVAAEPELAKRLFLEIDAHSLVELHERAAHLCRTAERLGVRVGLRRLAQQFGALTHLSGLPIGYVKLGGSFVTELTGTAGSQTLMREVIDLAHSHHIDVCAEDVPDSATVKMLESMGVTLMRGPGLTPSAGA